MLELLKLSSIPEIFDPVEFKPGVNLILGARSEKIGNQARKVNGVGKSLMIDFLHFALCRKYNDTRVSKIPEGVIPEDTTVVLDLKIGKTILQIQRSISEPNQPTISEKGVGSQKFSKIEEATSYLGQLLFETNDNAGQVGFRQVISLLMRDERSGFKDVLNPYDSKRRISPSLFPHLYLLGVDSNKYRSLLDSTKEVSDVTSLKNNLKSLLENGGERKIEDIQAIINEEQKTVEKIEEALDQLKMDPAFEEHEHELNSIEASLRKQRSERKKISFQINQIKSIPRMEVIDSEDIRIIFDQVKFGLGEYLEKSIDQVVAFKAEIDRFQQTLIQKELQALESQHSTVKSRISSLTSRHSQLTRAVDSKGTLKDISSGVIEAARISERHQELSSNYELYKKKESELSEKKHQRSSQLREFQKQIENQKKLESSLNQSFVDIHEKIQGTSKASFAFKVSEKATAKNPLSFVTRIDSDGSHSIDHLLIFLYDFTLLTNEFSKLNHPGFLSHDNILDVDHDTFARCLNFIQSISETKNFQYLLTLNTDLIEATESEIKLNIHENTCASFSKEKPFIKKKYQEER